MDLIRAYASGLLPDAPLTSSDPDKYIILQEAKQYIRSINLQIYLFALISRHSICKKYLCQRLLELYEAQEHNDGLD